MSVFVNEHQATEKIFEEFISISVYLCILSRSSMFHDIAILLRHYVDLQYNVHNSTQINKFCSKYVILGNEKNGRINKIIGSMLIYSVILAFSNKFTTLLFAIQFCADLDQ